MLHLNPWSPADTAMDHLARLATATSTTPAQMVCAVRDALDAWRRLPEERHHAMQLRTLMAAELAGALERARILRRIERREAWRAATLLRVGVDALGEKLAAS